MPDDLDALAAAAREAHMSRTYEVGGSALEHEAYRRIGSAVAARAVADANLEAAAMRKQLVAFSIHFPAIRDALTRAAADAEYDAQARPFRAALGALEGTGAQERSEEKEAGRDDR